MERKHCAFTDSSIAHPDYLDTDPGTGFHFDSASYPNPTVSVLDLVSQICDVVLVRRTFSSGKPQEVGISE